MLIRVLSLLLCRASAPVRAADYVGTDARGRAVDRMRLARTIYRHDFENRRDPDTGLALPESAHLNRDGWPDFWEPVRAVGFPEYLIPTVRVVPDDSGYIPGAYRDAGNHVLHMQFDGTKVGVRTRVPVPVDPELAYEFSLYVKDSGLDGARIRAGVDWMRIDPAATRVLRSDEIPDLATGQTDWPVAPARMLVNDPPDNANAARLFIILDRRPDAVGGAYHGEVWVDNIVLRPLPKIMIEAPRPGPDGDNALIIPVRYTGLIDNVPDPSNPGFFKGKRYFRRVEVADIHNQPINIGLRPRSVVEADDAGLAVEDVVFPRGRYGVYYFNIRLYDAEDRLATDVMRAVAVMRPERHDSGMAIRSARPLFGVRIGNAPDSILATSGLLRRILNQSGARITKLIPWRDSHVHPGDSDSYYPLLSEEIRGLRAGGFGVTGVVSPPSGMFGRDDLAQVLATDPDRLLALLEEAGRRLGLFMDAWQLGDDEDGSLLGFPSTPGLERLYGTLGDFAGGLPVTLTRRLDNGATGSFPNRPANVQAFLPRAEPLRRLWPLAAGVFPWLFERFFQERGLIYPPARLVRLAPSPPADQVEAQARDRLRGGTWISLESAPAYPHEPNAAAEKEQLVEFLTRAVYATALAPDAIFLGDLFDAGTGLLRRDIMGGNILETMARPTFLAAATVSDLLEGAEYLGQLGLLEPYEAHVFRRPGIDTSVIALWHNSPDAELTLSRREIANGPPLELVDWAGNTVPLPMNIPVRRVPSFITGLSASLALTRMSARIAPIPTVQAVNRRQNQILELVNHLPRQAPVLLRLRYAARVRDGAMENGWTVNPEEMRINLAPFTPLLTPGRLRYTASPDPNSPVQFASPAGVDKSGTKIAQVAMSVNTSPPADMLLYLPFRLHSEVDVDIEPLLRVDDPHFVTLQLKLRWFPAASERRRGDIKLIPYYVKKGQMKESAAFPVTVKALPVEDRDKADAPFESVEIRIPRNPQVQTWVGLTEDGGSHFYQAEVTDFLLAP